MVQDVRQAPEPAKPDPTGDPEVWPGELDRTSVSLASVLGPIGWSAPAMSSSRARKIARVEGSIRAVLAAPDALAPATALPSSHSVATRNIHPWRRYPAVRPR